jgi:hypothetical protein
MESREERKRPLAHAESPNKKIKRRAAFKTKDDPDERPRPRGLPDEIVSSEASDYEEGDERIENPLPSDILLGRGKPFQNHHGNQRMFEIVARYKEKYSSEKREKRRAIAEQVIDILLESGARFLKRVEGKTYWARVREEVAFEKVSHVLRSKKQKVKLPGESRKEAQLELNMSAAPYASQQFGLHSVAPTLPTAFYGPLVAHSALGIVHVPTLAPVVYAPNYLHGHHLMHQNSLRARSNIYDDIAAQHLARAQMDQVRMADSILRRRSLYDEDLYRRSLGL